MYYKADGDSEWVELDAAALSQPHRFAATIATSTLGYFAVLKAPDMPSVLIETGFLSNRQDEKVLQDSAHRAKLARSIVGAVDQFFAAEQTWSRL